MKLTASKYTHLPLHLGTVITLPQNTLTCVYIVLCPISLSCFLWLVGRNFVSCICKLKSKKSLLETEKPKKIV